MLNVIDEFTRECLAIRIDRKLKAVDVIAMFCRISSSCAACLGISGRTMAPSSWPRRARMWIAAVGARTAYIAPGSPRENGYVESFNARLRDELLDARSSTR